MVRVLVRRALQEILRGIDKQYPPADPVLLWKPDQTAEPFMTLKSTLIPDQSAIHTRINGKEYQFDRGYQKTLLDLVREDAGLTGSKEGCGEGECGACTMFLDGKAVMACLVPAPRAHGADIVTIEGLSGKGHLHPVQEAFITEGSVQCGFCTPGFVMSAAMLLEEKSDPTLDEIEEAISGNLCRCTGYYKIITAIEKASKSEGA
jgi:carbon-monoxide dehydrogenase medium subunit